MRTEMLSDVMLRQQLRVTLGSAQVWLLLFSIEMVYPAVTNTRNYPSSAQHSARYTCRCRREVGSEEQEALEQARYAALVQQGQAAWEAAQHFLILLALHVAPSGVKTQQLKHPGAVARPASSRRLSNE